MRDGVRRLNVALVGWTGHRANWGCQATSYGLLEDLRQAASPNLDLVITRIPLVGRMRWQRAVGRLLSPWLLPIVENPEAIGLRAWLFNKIAYLLHGEEAKALASADVMVYTAEGNLDGLDFDSGLGMLLLPKLAAMRHIPVLGLNQTVYLKDWKIADGLRQVFGCFDLLAVREEESGKFLNGLGLSNVLVIPDAAFRVQPGDEPFQSRLMGQVRAPLVCITGSAIGLSVLGSGYVRVAAEVAAQKGFQVCGVFWQPEAERVIQDACADAGGYPPVFVRSDTDYRGLTSILAESVCVIGGRYHTALKAVTVGTPIVLLPSGTHKSEGLIQLIDYPYPVRAFDDVDGIRADLVDVVDNRERLKEHLLSRMAFIQEVRDVGIEAIRQALRRIADQQAGTNLVDDPGLAKL